MLVNRNRLMCLFAVTISLLFTACTPVEQALFNTLNPEEQAAVISAIQEKQNQPTTDCYGAIRKVWPQNLWSWADSIVWREAGNTPTARNRSGASGCFQMMLPMHTRWFNGVGCEASQWSNAVCNSKAAYSLYQSAGKSPWRI